MALPLPAPDAANSRWYADKSGPLKLEPIWTIHWVVLGSRLLVFSVGAGIFGKKLPKSGRFPELLEDVRLIEGMSGVQAAGAQDLHWSNWGSGVKKRILVINVYWTGQAGDEQAFADQVAKLMLEHNANIKEYDLIRVVMLRGYDIGIAHAQVSHAYEHTPAEWNARLFGTWPVGRVLRPNPDTLTTLGSSSLWRRTGNPPLS